MTAPAPSAAPLPPLPESGWLAENMKSPVFREDPVVKVLRSCTAHGERKP